MTCKEPDCERPLYAKKAGWCSVHYNRNLIYGTPYPVLTRVVGDDVARFLSRITKTDTCWIWKKETKPREYPQMRVKGKNVCVHVWAYKQFVGPIPEGYQVDHLCRNIRCGNPSHLEAVTQLENLRRQQETNPRRGRTCDLEGCERKHRCHGLCSIHYHRWIYHGQPEDMTSVA